MTADTFETQLRPFIPFNTASRLFGYIRYQKIKLKITKGRNSKFGDYRPPQNGKNFHQISVNGDLNRYAFLLTFVHEIAHMHVELNHGKKAPPHGQEWKTTFRELMSPFLNESVFPANLLEPMRHYLQNPKASSVGHHGLYKALRSFDKAPAQFVMDLKEGDLFEFRDRTFVKGNKRRTRVVCYEEKSRRPYLFSPVAEIKVIKR